MQRLIPSGVSAIVVVVVLVPGLPGCSKDKKEATAASQPPGEKPSYFEQQKQTITATVEAIDYKTRVVTLRGSEGDRTTFKASDSVRNLNQVKVGDRVAIDYYESMAIKVQPPGEAINDVRIAVDRAEPGEKPGGMAAQHVTMTSIVDAMDKPASKVTLRAPDGTTRTIKVRDPRRLDNVKIGDRVIITYTEQLAVSVRPAPAESP